MAGRRPSRSSFLAGGLGLLWGAAGALYRWLATSLRVCEDQRGAMGPCAYPDLCGGVRGVRVVSRPCPVGLSLGPARERPGTRAGPSVRARPWSGAYGMSFITLAMACALGVWGGSEVRQTKMIRHRRRPRHGGAIVRGRRDPACARTPMSNAAATSLRVRVVQANIPQADKWSPEAFRSIFETYARLTARGAQRPGAAGGDLARKRHSRQQR